MTIESGKDMETAAELILQAWSNPAESLASLPEPLRPANLADAYGIQQALSRRLGTIGGWAIWDSDRLNSLLCAPLPLASIRLSPAHLVKEHWTYRRIVPRICVRVGASLPDYDAPYSRDRIIAAIESCHAGVEVRQPRFVEPGALDALTALADGDGYGCLVYDREGLAWRNADPLRGEVRILVGNTELPSRPIVKGWDVIDAVCWLANAASHWAGGLMVGHLVTVPTGAEEIDVPPDMPVRVVIGALGTVELEFGSGETRKRPARRFRQIWARRLIR
jgi:2-keto-4-pentenoate hydratase